MTMIQQQTIYQEIADRYSHQQTDDPIIGLIVLAVLIILIAKGK
jgi:hypothetical protein